EIVKALSNDSDDEDETSITNKAEGNEDEEIDYTISLLYDDVDIRMNDLVDADKGFVQEEGTDAAMNNKTEVPVTRSSQSSDLASKFLNFLDIPHTDAEFVSPMDVHYTPSSSHNHYHPSLLHYNNQHPHHHQQLKLQILNLHFLIFHLSSNSTTESQHWKKMFLNSKKDDPLKTQVTALVDEHIDARLGATRDEFMNYLSASIIARITEQVKIQLPQILPKEVSNFAPLEI
ncbi:hypothetical protein Tco_0022988, partial [Tanacetum coccineum]